MDFDVREKMQEIFLNAYSPYSSFSVAALIICRDGSMYEGVNVENASYGLSMCAERNAIYHAYMHNKRKEDIMILVVYTNKESLVYPCGACRQVMSELLDDKCEVIVMNAHTYRKYKVSELLPYCFGKENLHGI